MKLNRTDLVAFILFSAIGYGVLALSIPELPWYLKLGLASMGSAISRLKFKMTTIGMLEFIRGPGTKVRGADAKDSSKVDVKTD